MVGLIDIFYFSGGLIFWILGSLTFRVYLKNRFKNELYLSFYFFSIGWLFPLIIFIPNPLYDQFLRFLLIGANATIPLTLIFLNLFLDNTVFEGQSAWNPIIQFFGGGTTFMAIISSITPESVVFRLIPTVFGEYTIIDVVESSDLVKFVFYLMYLLIILIVIRFVIIGIRLAKRNVNNENFINVRRIILFMFSGQFLWIIVSLLKRSFPKYLIGVDFLIISLFNMVLVYYYIKHHELFYFLPSSLKVAILIYKSGIHLCDYNFTTKEIVSDEDNFDYTSLSLVRSVLYGASITIENVIQKEVGNENLKHINFDNTKIVVHQSKNIYWWLVCKKYSQYYSAIITKIANRVESKFQGEISTYAHGSRPSLSFKRGVKDEFDRIS